MNGWAWLAVSGWSVSTVIHVLTYFPVPLRFGAWFLGLVATGGTAFGAMVLRGARRRGSSRAPAGSEEEAQRAFDAFGRVPGLVWAIAPPVLLYLFLNFVLAAGTLREGEPRTTPDGRPYLDYKGRHVRDLSDAEYRRLSAAEVRLFTGHLIAFHGIAAIFFIWLDRRAPVARKG